jgi:hypothetical protein
MRMLVVSILCLACSGCEQHDVLVDENHLHQLVNSTRKDGAIDWVYLGTDDKYHYFARRYYWTNALLNPPFGPQCEFKVRKNEMEMVETFEPSRNQQGIPKDRLVFSKWRLIPRSDGTVDVDIIFDFAVRGDLGSCPTWIDKQGREWPLPAPASTRGAPP